MRDQRSEPAGSNWYTALVVAIAEPRPVAVEVAASLVRLIEFSSLESAWDGETALPPSPAALRNAMLFLIEQVPDGPAPAVGPGLDGSIEMEWELAGRPSVSVTFNTDGTAYFTAFTADRVLQEAQLPRWRAPRRRRTRRPCLTRLVGSRRCYVTSPSSRPSKTPYATTRTRAVTAWVQR